jgi:L-asparagine transporter-like permease
MLTASFSDLDDLSQARTERVLQAHTDLGPPWPLWAVMFVTGAMLLGCAILYSVENPATHFAMVAILAVLVGMILYLVLMLSHPYIGEIATSPEPLREVVRVLSPPP